MHQLFNFNIFICAPYLVNEVLILDKSYIPLHSDDLLLLVLIVVHLCGLC